ncbi:MAG: 16S rRNA (cytosine(967)-C(5))-methyltransferase RsmB [Clostridiales bacterium]|nr:16S rRNA (cytosine(967)-C(5))-methyltransferase RsmB [Clostridiales bacterium]
MGTGARQTAVEALLRVHRDGGYSHIVWEEAMNPSGLSGEDRTFASRLFYGVIERRLTLDFLIGSRSRTPLNRLHPAVREILRTGAYQLVFLDRIPPSAAVNEAVKLTRAMRQGHAAGYVNAVLRGIAREGRLQLEQLPAGSAGDEIRYSCPRELINLWKEAYGEAEAQQLVSHINDSPDTCIRVNTNRISYAHFRERITEQGIAFADEPGLPGCLRIEEPRRLKEEKELSAFWYSQDAASQWCCALLDPQPGERIADVCAAPGGKALTCSQWMENRGYLLAGDIYEHKGEVIHRRAAEFGASLLETVCRDASQPCPPEWQESFDRVLCDVPCSGLGVIRRKPEIRYKPLDTFQALPPLQYAILSEASKMVRQGGVLHYSTCTLNPAENEELVRRFLKQNTDFVPRLLTDSTACDPRRLFEANGEAPSYQMTLMPHRHHCDGFYMASFVRLPRE